MKILFEKLFRGSSNLSELEKLILHCVRGNIDDSIVELWDRQVQAINKVQRLPGGVEVDFYRMKRGRPIFDATLAFPNRTTELVFAKARVDFSPIGSLVSKLSCVKGFLFCIEYEGNSNYFEENIFLDPTLSYSLSCEMLADLSKKN